MPASDPRDSHPRSQNPADLQSVPRPLAAMTKAFAAGHVIPAHSHARDQLLYAVAGMMRVRTEGDAWIVPPDRAVYIPGGVLHSVAMRGRVEMRTLYIESGANPDLPGQIATLVVSPLLRELVLALLKEPVLYDRSGRAGLIEDLVLTEIAGADRGSPPIPMPRDRRLATICEALLADPGRAETLDQWAEIAGAAPRTLSRLMSSQLGLSFAAWRQRVRLLSAVEALMQGAPVGEVARTSGYASPSAFTFAFRKAFGRPPSSYAASGPTNPTVR
jgi:AraC-like DNA-binding protein